MLSRETYCRECRPDLFPSGPCQGEHHVAIRFGDEVAPFMYAYLDGQFVKWCTEAIAGTEGLVVVEPGQHWPLGCPCGSGLQPEMVLRGLVEVTNRKREG